MKNKIALTLSFFVLIGFNEILNAQLTIAGEFRPRTEYRHGFKTLASQNQDAALFTDQRTRLNFDFESKGYRFYLSIQDVRVWGSQKQLVVDDGATTTLHQAYAEIFLNDKLTLKTGRQEIIYDDHRIFGNVGWAQQARSHDAILFKFKNQGLKLDLGLAYNQNEAGLKGTTYTIVNSYKTFQYLWLHKDLKKMNVSILGLNNGLQVRNPGGTYGGLHFTQTLGTRIGYKAKKMTTYLSLYYQGGVLPDSLGTQLSASLLGLDIAYKPTKFMTVVLGFEQQSGNSQIATESKRKAFTPYYGTNHKFNGFMDYFYVGNHIQSVGLQDLYLKLKYKKGKLSTGIDGHYFLAAADVVDETSKAMPSGLAVELDLYMRTQIAEGVGLSAGYSQLFASETMQVLKGGDKQETANWAYMMIVIKPTFSPMQGKK